MGVLPDKPLPRGYEMHPMHRTHLTQYKKEAIEARKKQISSDKWTLWKRRGGTSLRFSWSAFKFGAGIGAAAGAPVTGGVSGVAAVGLIGSGTIGMGTTLADYNRNAREIHHAIKLNQLKNKMDQNRLRGGMQYSGFSEKDKSQLYRYAREKGEINDKEYVGVMSRKDLEKEVRKAQNRESREGQISMAKLARDGFSVAGSPNGFLVTMATGAINQAMLYHMKQRATFDRMEAEYMLMAKRMDEIGANDTVRSRNLDPLKARLIGQMDQTQAVGNAIRERVESNPNDPAVTSMKKFVGKRFLRDGKLGESVGINPDRVKYLNDDRDRLVKLAQEQRRERSRKPKGQEVVNIQQNRMRNQRMQGLSSIPTKVPPPKDRRRVLLAEGRERRGGMKEVTTPPQEIVQTQTMQAKQMDQQRAQSQIMRRDRSNSAHTPPEQPKPQRKKREQSIGDIG